MHEEEVNELVGKVLQADEIIHRQQLGWDWRAPDLDALRDVGRGAAALEETRPATADEQAPAVDGRKLKAMLELLSAEAGFLVEGKVKEALEKLPPEEAELAQAESMLRALGARDERDVALLVGHFFSDGAGEPDAPPDAAGRLANMIGPDDVISAVQAFVDARRSRQPGATTKPSAGQITSVGAENGLTGPAATAAAARRARAEEEREFWKRMANVVSDKTFDVWTQLEKHLQDYNKVLSERASEIQQVTSLQEQNVQLKALINQYLNAKVNDELIVPPSSTITLPGAGEDV